MILTWNGEQGTPVDELTLKSKGAVFTKLDVDGSTKVKDLEITGNMVIANTLTVNANNLVIDEGNGKTTTILEYIMKLMYLGGNGGDEG